MVEKIAKLHVSQLAAYLKIARKRLGLLLNFNTVIMRDGIKRVAL